MDILLIVNTSYFWYAVIGLLVIAFGLFMFKWHLRLLGFILILSGLIAIGYVAYIAYTYRAFLGF